MSDKVEWPPKDGKAFIRSELFGDWLYEAAQTASKRNPRLDFSDAYAQVFEWFDRTLKRNRRFINKRRFPSPEKFRAYLNQSVKRAALQSLRQRNRKWRVEPLAAEFEDASHFLSVDQLLDMLEHIRPGLDLIDQRILDWLLDQISGEPDSSPELIAASLGIDVADFERRLGRILDDLPC